MSLSSSRKSRRIVYVLSAAVGWVSLASLSAISPTAFAQSTAPAGTQPGLERPAIRASTAPSRFSRSAEREIQFQEGLLRYSRGQLAAAENDFKAVVTDDPADSEAYYYLGLAQLDQGKSEESLANFDQSLRIDTTADEVRAAKATALIRLRRLDEAENELKALEPDPRWKSLVAYERGQLLYAKGDLEGAAQQFAAAKAAGGSEATPAGFYEGLTYIRMRELVRARTVFRESSSINPDRDPTVVAASRQLDAVLSSQQQSSKPWEVQLTLGYEYDSNVIQLGADQQVPEGISGTSDSRFVVQPRGSYTFLRNGPVELGVEASGYFTWQFELSDFDLASYQGGPFINYKLADNLYASARYSFNYIESGHDPFLVRNIVTPQLTYIEQKFGYTSAFYQFQDRSFKGDPVLDQFDRDGYVNSIGIVQGIILPSLFPDTGKANLELSYRYLNQNTEGRDYDSNSHAVGVTLYTPLPFFKLRADAGLNGTFDFYTNPNSIDATGDERQDNELNVVVGLTKEITRGVSVRADYTFTDHFSNVETASGVRPFEFDRHVFGVRLILSY